MKAHEVNKLNNFIAGWYVSPKVCDDMIEHFHINESQQHPGMIGHFAINTDIKKSTDVFVTTDNINLEGIVDYFSELRLVIEEYKIEYPYCDNLHSSWSYDSLNIQRYLPGEAFYQWHCEVSGLRNCHRHLNVMTYLNTIEEGGETAFYHQDLKIKPEKGLTIVTPTSWMFVHKGMPAKETKYITTGYYSYIE